MRFSALSLPSCPSAGTSVLSGFLSLALLAGCGGSTSPDPDKDRGGAKNPKAAIKLVPVIAPTANPSLARRIVGNTGEGLQSFQVMVKSIRLVRDLQTQGSGYSGETGSLSLYEDVSYADHNAITAEQARDPANASKYVDFMSATSLGRLARSAPFTESGIGDYHYAVVDWAKPFKVRAEVGLGDGRSVYTKDGSIDPVTGRTLASSSTLEGPAEDAIVVKNNGGTWFRFLAPLRVTREDLTGTLRVPLRDTARTDSTGAPRDTAVAVDSTAAPRDTLVAAGQLSILLVFNPDGLLAAWDTAFADARGPEAGSLLGPGGLGNLHVPFLDATAVPFREGEAVMRETYRFEAPDPQIPGTMSVFRLELYVIGNNIMAASFRGLPGTGDRVPHEAPRISFAVEATGGVLTLEDHAHEPVVSPFRRLGAVGETGTAEIRLPHVRFPGASYRMEAVRRVSP